MDGIEGFKKLRDVCDSVIKAYESEDTEKLDAAMGRFLMLMLEWDALK
jgi:hypothetical protein